MPIRRTTHPTPAKTLELIRKEIELYATVFPEVSFSLEDTSRTHENSSGGVRLLSITRTSSMLATFRAIHGRVLAEVRENSTSMGISGFPTPFQRVQELDESIDGIIVSGFISLSGALSKVGQPFVTSMSGC